MNKAERKLVIDHSTWGPRAWAEFSTVQVLPFWPHYSLLSLKTQDAQYNHRESLKNKKANQDLHSPNNNNNNKMYALLLSWMKVLVHSSEGLRWILVEPPILWCPSAKDHQEHIYS